MTVNPMDDAPVMANPLPDISVDEDASDLTIDLSHVFTISMMIMLPSPRPLPGDPSLVTVSVAGGNTLTPIAKPINRVSPI